MRNIKICFIILLILTISVLSSCHTRQFEIDYNNAEDKLFAGLNGTGNIEMVKEAIHSGADINLYHNQKLRTRVWNFESECNPFIIAIFDGNFEGADLLLEYGADMNYSNKKSGKTILSYCAESRSDYIDKVVSNGADINYVDKSKRTALDYAIEKCNVDSVKAILKYHPKINKKTAEILTEKIIAEPMNEQYYSIANMLLDENNDLEIDSDIKSAFIGEIIDIDNYLSNDSITKKLPVLVCAISAGCNKKCLQYAVEKTDILKEVSVEHLFSLAAMFGNIENMKYLIEIGADINDRNSDNNSAVDLAVKSDQIDSVKFLKNIGADFSASKDINKKDSLYFAVKNNNLQMVEILLPMKCFNFTQATILAVQNCNFDILQYFFDNGVDVNTNDGNGCNLLTYAVLTENINMIKYILDCGANINDNQCENPLYYATEKGNGEIMEYLISRGADVNTVRCWEDGSVSDVPIIKAISIGQLEALKVLVKNGADIYIDCYGRNIVEYAAYCGSDNIYEYLKQIY